MTQSFSFQSRLCTPATWGREENIGTKWVQGLLWLCIFSVGIFLLTSKTTCNHANIKGTAFKRINHNCWAQLCTAEHTPPPGELSFPWSRQCLLGRSNLKTASVEPPQNSSPSKRQQGSSCLPGPHSQFLAAFPHWVEQHLPLMHSDNWHKFKDSLQMQVKISPFGCALIFDKPLVFKGNQSWLIHIWEVNKNSRMSWIFISV